MSIDRLIQQLEKDKALFFDKEQVVIQGQGWAAKYADMFQAITFGDLEIYRSTQTQLDPDDEKDLRIIASRAEYNVTAIGNKILFEAQL